MYNFSNYEPNVGRLGNVRGGGHPALGKTRGQTATVHLFDTEDHDEDDEECDLDLYVDDVLKDKITKKTDSIMRLTIDPGKRTDKGDATGTNIGGIAGISESPTTKAVKGISPRLTYRTKSNTKGPALGAQASAKYIRDKNFFYHGTQYGTSRAPLPRHNQTTKNIWSLSDMDIEQPFERQNRIKNFILSLEDNTD